ncbi:MAG: transglycosylase SLT domain-containing protein [Anaerolineales bacterium]
MTKLHNAVRLFLVLFLTACQITPGSGTLSPTASPTPRVAPSFTASPTTPPTPTPNPITSIQGGKQALFYGDFDGARAEFEAAFRSSADPQVQAAALWGLGRTAYADGRYNAALDILQQLVEAFPESPLVAYAQFMLGQTYYAMKRYAESADAYQAYLQMRPGVLDAYVQEARGDAFFEDANYADALVSYSAALAASPSGHTLFLEAKLAQTRAGIGDYASAVAAYDSIFTRAEDDYTKAYMDYLSGQAYLKVGQNEQAYRKFLHAVENYPLSYDAYLSLVELVNAGVPVSDLDRGLVDYFAGQYDVALAAFDRYLNAGLDSDGTARYYRALTLRALQNYEAAIQDFSTFLANYPTHPKWGEAWMEKASTQWLNIGDYKNGAQTYLDFVAAAPTHPQAVEALMSAARILERDNRLEQAAQTWQRVADEYPDSEQTSQALFLAGIVQYRLGAYDLALPVFQRDLLLSTQKEDQARAYVWIGKTQEKLGNQPARNAAWQRAQALDPNGYYSERARELLLGQVPFQPPAKYDLDINVEAERKDAAAWVRIRFNLPPETDLNGLGNLAGDPRLARGVEFWELGLYQEAKAEFESLREAVSDSPENSFRLANFLLDLGVYRSAIFAARQVLTLAGLDEQSATLSAPLYFNHLRYGTYYADLIESEAAANGLHPLFLFSVVRQESLFEGFVRSPAGARGLMQIIPSTGGSIANQMGWPINYDDDDLYRPLVSLRMGAYYLASNRDLLGGDLYAALAAYNAGPGNAAAWKDLSGDDPDLLLEVVRFQETRDYIRHIYEIYAIYKTLYSITTQS